MKYFVAALLIPAIPILLIVFFAIGALYFGVINLLEWKKQYSPEYTAAKKRAQIYDARAFQR
jgi:hypothetical protein